jgi:uncharacterized damage-inducible protein DinB
VAATQVLSAGNRGRKLVTPAPTNYRFFVKLHKRTEKSASHRFIFIEFKGDAGGVKMDLAANLVETWQINNRINLYLLEGIAPEALKGTSASKGRNVGEQFAHIHNVRLMWLKSSAPELMADLQKLEDTQDKEVLRQALEASGKAIAELLKKSLEAGGRVKGFKPHVTAFLGYLISHDSYHRGEIGIILRQAGFPLDKKISYGLWEWGVR